MQFPLRQQAVPIGGVRVLFPFKPYPSQKAMMAKIIQALNHADNALLESPTGSGKSLALLCSALGWQARQWDKAEGEAKAALACSCPCHVKTKQPPASTGLVPTLCQDGTGTSISGFVSCQNGLETCSSSVVVDLTSTPAATDTGGCVEQPDQGADSGTQSTAGSGVQNEAGSGVQSSGVQSMAGSGVQNEAGSGAHSVADSGVQSTAGSGDSHGDVRAQDVKVEPDEDFRKPKKRYRTPGGAASVRGCKRSRVRGVVYEEEEEEQGGSMWRMEVNQVEQLPASQQPSVMDTGPQSGPPPAPLPTPSTSTQSTVPPPSQQPPCTTCQCANMAWQKMKSQAVPKVYFGTRTHQQISQITHELAKTAYTSTPMCILGSREHTCIHPVVSRARRKNDECKKLLDEGGCSFYYRVAKKLGSQAQVQQHGMTTAWDMEDFVSLGKKVKACPYFALRGIKEEAQIVFCPYNYLIDPLIRDQMQINLAGQVVVLDEAHNMEDSAREAASQTLTSAQLDDASSELSDILDEYFAELRPSFEFLASVCVSIKNWMDATISSLPHDGFDQACGIWCGQDFVPVLQGMGIIASTPALIKKHITSIMDAVSEQKLRDQREERQGKKRSVPVPSPSTTTVSVLKGLAMVLSYLLRDGLGYADDYRISLMRTTVTKDSDNGWKRRRRSKVPERVWLYSLHFWCLNPSVAFSELSLARSVILTSGTLSPLSSFSSELGMVFNIQLEANHVVPEAQTFIRSVSCGPHGKVLCANYQNSETYAFQDETGAVVEQVCQTVPSGVLCFFSSYKMLNKLVQRWKVTGMWTNIEQKKAIIIEPHGSSKAEFESAIKQFYATVENSNNGVPAGHMTGALFLAVCRGKVSEGLDFADNNARAVITIGIPFPSIKDKQVELKREYNNQYCRERGLLTGSEWYEIQAFRAINQALGRCIRHRRDWGALILVDERFSKGHRYTRGLSKWIRQRVSHERDFSSAMRALTAFSERMTSNPSLTDTSAMEVSHSFADSSTVLYSTQDLVRSPCPTPLPSSPSISSYFHPVTSTPTPHLHPVTSTPTPQAATGKAGWLPPYCNTNPQQQQQQSQQCCSSAAIVPPAASSLGSLISRLRAFQYPGQTQPHSPLRAHNVGPPPPWGTTLPHVPLSSGPVKQESSGPPPATRPMGNGCFSGTVVASLDESVEITHVETSEYAAEHPILVESSPPKPHTSTTPALFSHTTPAPSSHTTPVPPSHISPVPPPHISPAPSSSMSSPLLFPSTEATVTPTPALEAGRNSHTLTPHLPPLTPHPPPHTPPPPVAVPVPPTPVNQTLDQSPNGLAVDHSASQASAADVKIGDGVKIERVVEGDADETPPLSPSAPSHLTDGASEGRLNGVLAVNGGGGSAPVPKTSTPLRRRKLNTRMASNNKGSCQASMAGSGCGKDGRHVRGSRTTRSTCSSIADGTEVVSGTVTCSGCGQGVSRAAVLLKRLELKEAFSCQLGKVKVQTSQLWGHIKTGQGGGRVAHTYLLSAADLDVTCREREDGLCNAVWDEKLSLCYGLLECTCSHMVGVKVHADTMGCLTNKVLLSVEKTNIST